MIRFAMITSRPEVSRPGLTDEKQYGWVPPSPPGGYFVRNILAFNGLRGFGICKIQILKGLCLKYLYSAV